MGIKSKTTIFSIVFMSLLTIAVAAVGSRFYYTNLKESYSKYAEMVLASAYDISEDYGFGDMIRDRSMPEDYEKFRLKLNRVKDDAEIEYLYAIYFEDIDDINSLHYAINAKSREELERAREKSLPEIYTYMGKPCEEGSFQEDTLLVLQKAIKGKKRDSGILMGHSGIYGFMLNGYHVIYDSEDEAVGLMCVEINVNKITRDILKYIRKIVVVAVLITAGLIVIYIMRIQRNVINPIEKITWETNAFMEKMHSQVSPEELTFGDVEIHTKDEMDVLAKNVKSMADSVSSYMVNLKKVTSDKERISVELRVATGIQAALLPRDFPAYTEDSKFNLFASMTPAKEVGGDFYDFFMVDDDHIALIMADVSGKGIPAALFMAISKTLIKNSVMSGNGPADALYQANEQLCEGNESELFVTVWLAVIELSTGKGKAANAGHEHPVLRRADGKYKLVKYRHSVAVATMEGIRFKEHDFEIHPGDSIFVYTDGVPEATDAKNELYGTDRMLEALNGYNGNSPKELLGTVRKSVDDFVDEAPQFDDLTMLCFNYYGGKQDGDEKT